MINYNSKFQDLVLQYPNLWFNRRDKARTPLIRYGDVANQNFYVETGVVRAFYYSHKKAKEITIDFFTAGDAILPYKGFAKNQVVLLYYEVIADASIWVINGNDWKKIEKKEARLNELIDKENHKLIRRLVEFSIIRDEFTAKERYAFFLQKRNYASIIKDEHIASFLRMDKSTLSRNKLEQEQMQNE